MTNFLYRNIWSSCNSPVIRVIATYKPFLQQERGFSSKYSDSLPFLPVPLLSQTIDKFINFLKPLQSRTDFEQTNRLAKKFLESNEAQELQSLLEARAAKLTNWLTPWWLNVAYLSARTPLPVVTSPGITFPHFKFEGLDAQLECAAKIIESALRYHHHILKDELEEDKGPGKVPFDMSQYKLMFGTTRIPKHGQDEIRYGKDQPVWAKHILVTRNGHTYKFPVYTADGNGFLGVEEMVTRLRAIIAESAEPNPHPINIVSSNDRETWAAVYERLKENSPGEIQSVEDALFVVSLDKDYGDEGKIQADRNMEMALHGGGSTQNTHNRWFDKTLQFNINEHGYGGITYEHTPAEGPPLSMLLDFICDQMFELNMFEQSTDSAQPEKPTKLQFQLNGTDEELIVESAKRIDSVVQNLEVRSLAFDHFGKNVPKRANFSPDSWIQVALQLSYFRIHRAHPPAYETGSLRKFSEGRTDTIRLPNLNSVKFVEAASNISSSQMSATELVDLLEAAIVDHKRYSREVMNGMGIDRHLLGLRLIAVEQGLPIPELLQSSAYKRLMHFLLSTSQVPTKHVLPMGFGPSAPDCYGVCYNPQESRTFFTITAFNECAETSAEKFSRELERTLLDMRDLVDKAGRLKVRAKL